MDEFFNFEEAAQHPLASAVPTGADLSSGPYDIDLAFAQPEFDEDSFTCLQHFASSQAQEYIPGSATTDTAMLVPGDFADFPRWIDGFDIPAQPCSYCRRMRIHCKVIREGIRKGSCTSCVALARSCSLTVKDSPENWKFDNARDFNTMMSEDRDNELLAPEFPIVANMRLQTCDYCLISGLECKMIQDGELKGHCLNCVSHSRTCSFVGTGGEDVVIGESDAPLDSPWAGSFPTQESVEMPHSLSAPNLKALNRSDENLNADINEGSGKVGARFSRESLRILRNWLSTHHNHPYPTDEEKDILKRQTGLTKTQITNWLANARRRGKVRPPRSTSPGMNNYAAGIDIPRRATPALEAMNPMERWQHSPPEHEPASVSAIAKAVTSSTFSSGRASPHSFRFTDDGSGRSVANVSSTSSLGTSQSSGNSFASAFSHKSRGSFGSFGSFGNRGRRRRRRQAPKAGEAGNIARAPPKAFQCTFCTETFKTKHDWQRHEKSLHLSLERWVCSPNGPAAFNAEYGQPACVYCGLPSPPKEHFEEHNHSSCAERSEEERTFYRKDHLRQHLNLVHDVKFQSWSMDAWKVATPEIRSRCGFCGLIMDTWGFRVDHLAEHFKSGKSMADWKGDWGFDQAVHDLVENGMPPYLIHDERNTLKPYVGEVSAEQRRTPYDLVKITMVDFLNDHIIRGEIPTDEDLLAIACSTIQSLEAARDNSDQSSWFRDLLLSPGSSPRKDSPGKDRSTKVTLPCSPNQIIPETLEPELMDFVQKRLALGLTPTDKELQVECCRLIDEAEKSSNFKCKPAVLWFKYLINDSRGWLADFRKRASLPRSESLICEHMRNPDGKTIDFTIHNHRRLERDLINYVMSQRARGHTPSDSDIQRQARMIIYGNDDPWNQTVADNPEYIEIFKRQYGLAPQISEPSPSKDEDFGDSCMLPGGSPASLHWDLADLFRKTAVQSGDQPLYATAQNQPSANSNPTLPLRYFLNDANCYRRLVRELKRFVQSCLSPNNPNQHIPTDGEIQNQARWVIYDDDDPWNQTAADNAEWLVRFKRDAGLLPSDSGPGLPETNETWQISKGGSGFSPPYAFPKQPPAPYNDEVKVTMGPRNKPYMVNPDTANSMLQSLTMRYEPPGKIFCSRELETGLNDFVANKKTKGMVPSDDDLRAEARKILGIEQTAADDQQLLDKFKSMHGIPSIQYTTPVDCIDSSVSPAKAQEDSAMMTDIVFDQFGTDIPGIDDIANLDMTFDMNFPDGSTF
ncbi:hypothetical protein F5884DRAFT_661842 [Xylogone sp. PMI_703]|nr:hypothetical protein F5884DRAFT_661842 [Xylogone sp. PMI_703]